MRKFLLLYFSCLFRLLFCRKIYITFDRGACKPDQSDCDGTRELPFANSIFALQYGIQVELSQTSGNLEFFFEAGFHVILRSDFLIGKTNLKEIFDIYMGII